MLHSPQILTPHQPWDLPNYIEKMMAENVALSMKQKLFNDFVENLPEAEKEANKSSYAHKKMANDFVNLWIRQDLNAILSIGVLNVLCQHPGEAPDTTPLTQMTITGDFFKEITEPQTPHEEREDILSPPDHSDDFRNTNDLSWFFQDDQD